MTNHRLKSMAACAAALLLAAGCSTPATGRNPELKSPVRVQVAVDTEAEGVAIPEDFIGLSFETGSVRKNNAGMPGYFFSGGNAQSLHIFGELGIRHLRVGGGSVDMNKVAPTFEEIDELFAFAAKSGVKVVYSLRLLNGDLDGEVAVARYVWERYREHIDCFSIGNEPDWNSYHKPDPEIRDYPSYLAKWKRFAAAVVAEIPEARFMGPNTGSNFPVAGARDTNHEGASWTVHFVRDLKQTGWLAKAAQHNYVGQDVDGNSVPWEMIDKMLSTEWNDRNYPALYHATLEPVQAEGCPWRLAESNSFSGQCDGGSNSFATALFALDYMYWWASHGCAGVNFHNKQWVLNAPIGLDRAGDLFVNPVGYGIKAFHLGGKGRLLPLVMENRSMANMTAYAARQGRRLCITLINKEHGYDVREVEVRLDLKERVAGAETLTLASPDGKATSRQALLGGAAIDSRTDWQGRWRQHDGALVFSVPASSALIVRISLE